MKTAFVWHERLMWFDSGTFAGPMPATGWVQPGEASENPEAKRRIKNLLDASGFISALDVLLPVPAVEADILRVHPQAYLDKVKALSAAHGGQLGASAFLGPGTFDIVMLSAGAAISAMEAVLSGRARTAYAFTRPPGHHAEPHSGLGFCVFANIAIAIKAMKARHGLTRVAVVDWDVHHGNGTQACFYDDPSVLTISLHQNGLFPQGGIGSASETGEGPGVGANINVPLPAGCGTAAYRYAFDRVVMPALAAFKPEMVVVANGLDAGNNDPLGRMMLGPEDFRWMTVSVREAAEKLCGGRLVLCHEGGYSAPTAPFLALPIFEELTGTPSGITNPLSARIAGLPPDQLFAHQKHAVDHARASAPLLRDIT